MYLLNDDEVGWNRTIIEWTKCTQAGYCQRENWDMSMAYVLG